MRNTAASLLVVAAAASMVLSAAGCKKTYTYPSQSISVNPVNQPDGSLNLRVDYTVTNASAKPVTFTFPSGKQFDAWLVLDGKEIARESQGKMYTQAFTSFTLQPGESKKFAANLLMDEKSRESTGGRYELHAELVGHQNMCVVLNVVPTGGGATVVPEVDK